MIGFSGKDVGDPGPEGVPDNGWTDYARLLTLVLAAGSSCRRSTGLESVQDPTPLADKVKGLFLVLDERGLAVVQLDLNPYFDRYLAAID